MMVRPSTMTMEMMASGTVPMCRNMPSSDIRASVPVITLIVSQPTREIQLMACGRMLPNMPKTARDSVIIGTPPSRPARENAPTRTNEAAPRTATRMD